MDRTAIIIIITFLIGIGLIFNWVEKKFPLLYLGLYVYWLLATDGILRLIAIIIVITKVHELSVGSNNNNQKKEKWSLC